jgi:hypothetical protein
MLAAAVDGTRVAISRCVTRIDPVLATPRELISRVLLPRVSFANVRPRPHRGDSFDPLGVGTLTLPPTSPPHAGRWSVSAPGNRSSSSALTPGCRRLELTTAPTSTPVDVPILDRSKARFVGKFERTLGPSCRRERPFFRICLPVRPLMPRASVTVRHSGGDGNGVSEVRSCPNQAG